MRDAVRVAAVQLGSGGDKPANLQAADEHVRAAAAAGAELIVLPEKWSAIGGSEVLKAGAEPLDGPAISWARATARELSIDLVAGSIAERPQGGEMLASTSGGEMLSNTSVHVGPDGEIKATYRKIHMFDVEVGGRSYRESALEQPGSEVVTTSAGGVRVGMSICYDLRFPELFRILALRGALVVVLPSAFTLPTTREHWEVLLRARAIENQVFMVAANQAGRHPGGYHSGGRSMVVDPWGEIVASAGESGTGPVLADLDLKRQSEIRAKLPSLANRRADAYRWPAAGGEG